jgi:hypothetical protein
VSAGRPRIDGINRYLHTAGLANKLNNMCKDQKGRLDAFFLVPSQKKT